MNLADVNGNDWARCGMFFYTAGHSLVDSLADAGDLDAKKEYKAALLKHDHALFCVTAVPGAVFQMPLDDCCLLDRSVRCREPGWALHTNVLLALRPSAPDLKSDFRCTLRFPEPLHTLPGTVAGSDDSRLLLRLVAPPTASADHPAMACVFFTVKKAPAASGKNLIPPVLEEFTSHRKTWVAYNMDTAPLVLKPPYATFTLCDWVAHALNATQILPADMLHPLAGGYADEDEDGQIPLESVTPQQLALASECSLDAKTQPEEMSEQWEILRAKQTTFPNTVLPRVEPGTYAPYLSGLAAAPVPKKAGASQNGRKGGSGAAAKKQKQKVPLSLALEYAARLFRHRLLWVTAANEANTEPQVVDEWKEPFCEFAKVMSSMKPWDALAVFAFVSEAIGALMFRSPLQRHAVAFFDFVLATIRRAGDDTLQLPENWEQTLATLMGKWISECGSARESKAKAGRSTGTEPEPEPDDAEDDADADEAASAGDAEDAEDAEGDDDDDVVEIAPPPPPPVTVKPKSKTPAVATPKAAVVATAAATATATPKPNGTVSKATPAPTPAPAKPKVLPLTDAFGSSGTAPIKLTAPPPASSVLAAAKAKAQAKTAPPQAKSAPAAPPSKLKLAVAMNGTLHPLQSEADIFAEDEDAARPAKANGSTIAVKKAPEAAQKSAPRKKLKKSKAETLVDLEAVEADEEEIEELERAELQEGRDFIVPDGEDLGDEDSVVVVSGGDDDDDEEVILPRRKKPKTKEDGKKPKKTKRAKRTEESSDSGSDSSDNTDDDADVATEEKKQKKKQDKAEAMAAAVAKAVAAALAATTAVAAPTPAVKATGPAPMEVAPSAAPETKAGETAWDEEMTALLDSVAVNGTKALKRPRPEGPATSAAPAPKPTKPGTTAAAPSAIPKKAPDMATLLQLASPFHASPSVIYRKALQVAPQTRIEVLGNAIDQMVISRQTARCTGEHPGLLSRFYEDTGGRPDNPTHIAIGVPLHYPQLREGDIISVHSNNSDATDAFIHRLSVDAEVAQIPWKPENIIDVASFPVA